MKASSISIAIFLIFSGTALAENTAPADANKERKYSAKAINSIEPVAYKGTANRFVVDETGKVRLLTARDFPASEIDQNARGLHAADTYIYHTANGVERFNLVDDQSKTSKSRHLGDDSKVSVRQAYGQTMWLAPWTAVPYGWGTISGNPGEWLNIKYLLGAPYGAVEFLNSRLPIPGGWARINGSHGYGTFKNVNGAVYGRQETMDSSYGIPMNWIRTSTGGVYGGYYGTFTYVLGAPFAAQIWADPTFPIPNNWVRVSTPTPGPGTSLFRNTMGAPSGTQWYVDATWGIPSGWTYVDNGYPMRLARKN